MIGPPWQRPSLMQRVLSFLGLTAQGRRNDDDRHPLERWTPVDVASGGQRQRVRDEVIRLARRVDQLEQEVRELRRR